MLGGIPLFVQTSHALSLMGGRGWSGGARVLGKLSVPGRPIDLASTRQGPIALAVGADGCCLDSFFLVYLFSFLSPSLGDGPI